MFFQTIHRQCSSVFWVSLAAHRRIHVNREWSGQLINSWAVTSRSCVTWRQWGRLWLTGHSVTWRRHWLFACIWWYEKNAARKINSSQLQLSSHCTFWSYPHTFCIYHKYFFTWLFKFKNSMPLGPWWSSHLKQKLFYTVVHVISVSKLSVKNCSTSKFLRF